MLTKSAGAENLNFWFFFQKEETERSRTIRIVLCRKSKVKAESQKIVSGYEISVKTYSMIVIHMQNEPRGRRNAESRLRKRNRWKWLEDSESASKIALWSLFACKMTVAANGSGEQFAEEESQEIVSGSKSASKITLRSFLKTFCCKVLRNFSCGRRNAIPFYSILHFRMFLTVPFRVPCSASWKKKFRSVFRDFRRHWFLVK